MDNKRVIIVGGGLSGICLAHQFINRGIVPTVIDNGANHSSKIAAGMINPMVFRAMVKTWKGDLLLPYLERFYKEMENKIGGVFFHPLKIRRLFATTDEKDNWIERENDAAYKEYIYPLAVAKNIPSYALADFGSGWVKSPGYVDALQFLGLNNSYLTNIGALQIDQFDYNALNIEENSYKNERYDALIFAEGYHGKSNPFFGYLPLQQTKGEVLTIISENLRKDEILNRKCFVLPTQDGLFRLGATFSWNTADLTPTDSAKATLLEQYNTISNASIKVIDHQAGIRPTVIDRRPLLGEHPKHQKVYIFNGMGTKGYMLAPYFSEHFVDFILTQKPLMDEVDIKRFEKKHFNKDE
jgi:glycine oxidase